MFSISPLWKQFDPLPIVSAQAEADADSEGDRVEKLFDEQSGNKNA